MVREAIKAWNDDYAPSMGAALAYYTLFSIAPLILLVLAIAGLLFGEEAAPARKQASGWFAPIRSRVLSFGMILAVAFVLMVSLVTSAVLAALGEWRVLDLAASFALTTLMCALIYKIIPRVRIRCLKSRNAEKHRAHSHHPRRQPDPAGSAAALYSRQAERPALR